MKIKTLRQLYKKRVIIIRKRLVTELARIEEDDLLDWLLIAYLLGYLHREVETLKNDVSKEIFSSFEDTKQDTVDYVSDVVKSVTGLDFEPKLEYNGNEERVSKLIDRDFVRLENKIAMILKGGLVSGTPSDEIVTAITKAIYDENGNVINGDLYNSMRIIRTENTRERTILKYRACQQMKLAGIDAKRRWVYTWESKVPRGAHIDENNILESGDGTFTINGHTSIGPGCFGVPEEDINCRCDTEIVINI